MPLSLTEKELSYYAWICKNVDKDGIIDFIPVEDWAIHATDRIIRTGFMEKCSGKNNRYRIFTPEELCLNTKK